MRGFKAKLSQLERELSQLSASAQLTMISAQELIAELKKLKNAVETLFPREEEPNESTL